MIAAHILDYTGVNFSINQRTQLNVGQFRLPVSLYSLSHFAKNPFRHMISFDSSINTNRSHKIDDAFSLNINHNMVLRSLLKSDTSSSSQLFNSHTQFMELVPCPVNLMAFYSSTIA